MGTWHPESWSLSSTNILCTSQERKAERFGWTFRSQSIRLWYFRLWGHRAPHTHKTQKSPGVPMSQEKVICTAANLAYRPFCQHLQQGFVCVSEPAKGALETTNSRAFLECWLRYLWQVERHKKILSVYSILYCGFNGTSVWLCSQHAHLHTVEVHSYLTLKSGAS